MADYLDKDEFVPFAPEALGEEVHIHHCKQGKDNDRLYIKRKYDGTIIAYCHHCGARGLHRESGPTNIYAKRAAQDAKAKKSDGTLVLPKDIELDVSKWPKDSRVWPLKYGLTEEEINANHLGYSKFYGGVVLPAFDEKGALTTFSIRYSEEGIRATEKSTGRPPPKYRTYRDHGAQGIRRMFRARYSGIPLPSNSKRIAVLVEDMLSAIKVSRVADGYALLGTSLDDKAVFTLAKKYDIIFIWLDNDNIQVKKTQSKLLKRLQLYNRNINIIYTDKDPKEYTTSEIRDILK